MCCIDGTHTVELALAGDSTTGDDGGAAWASTHALVDDERKEFTIDAFDYAGTTDDGGWQGEGACRRLGLELGMRISSGLQAKGGDDAPKPITHLKLTVSARQPS